MPKDELSSSERVLDPVERSSEVLFGLIMVLTFTSSHSAAEAGRSDVRTMIIAALGCNLAWGIIDAMMYLMASLSEKGYGLAMLNAVRSSPDNAAAQSLISSALPPVVAAAMDTAQFEQIRQRLIKLTDVPDRPHLTRRDWTGALGVFLLVFLSTLPVVAPFFFVQDVRFALRVSNLAAIVMLAIAGYSYGRYSGQREWVWSLSMVVVGLAMVALTVALGG